MKKTTKFVLALSASAALALGATAPALAGPPSQADRGLLNACSVAADEGVRGIPCPPPSPGPSPG